jgi:hypothetical protein
MSSRIVDDWVREGLRAGESAEAPPNRLFSVDTPPVRPRGFFYLPVPIVLLAVWVLRPAIIAADRCHGVSHRDFSCIPVSGVGGS